MPDRARADARPSLARPPSPPGPDATLAPLLARFPGLAHLPRVALGTYPTPVERVPDAAARRLLDGSGELWIKRDDLGAERMGGNKVRALELLLAGAAPGDTVLTVGARGSTHALATAVHAARLGARTRVIRWTQVMNDDARRTSHRLEDVARLTDVRTPVEAMLLAALLRLRRGTRWVPAGGTSPLGMLGHVNAALELADQVRAGALPEPARVVLPLGTGGTMAGLALGFAIAGWRTVVVGARVVPRIVARGSRVRSLARRTARLLGRAGGVAVPAPVPESLRIVHEVYGGAYGRPTASGAQAAAVVHDAMGLRLDATYAAKAAAALRAAGRDGPTLFWLTFDGRWMQDAAAQEHDDRRVR